MHMQCMISISIILQNNSDSVSLFDPDCRSRNLSSKSPSIDSLTGEYLKHYIFNCKKVEGVRHFRPPIAEGIEIIEHMRGYTSGMAVPTFIITAPDGRGKTPMYPQYLLQPGVHGKALIRTWGGHVLEYDDEGEAENGEVW